MATQLKHEPEAEAEPPANEAEPHEGERDYDAEARQRGWLPQDDFRGDKSRWVDAQTFIERTDTVMPLLKADRDRLKRELNDMKREFKRISRHISTSEERIREEIQAEMEEAVKDGDMAAFKKAQGKADKLAEPTVPAKHSQEDAMEAFDSFRDANPWYDKANLASASEIEKDARIYADRMTERHLDKTKEMAPDEFFGFIGDLVKEKFPDLTARPRREKPQSDVSAAGTGRAPRGGKTWEALPDPARRQFEKWIGQGMGDKAYYLKSFDWTGYDKAAG
jgi:hypothetical protein